MKYPTKKESSKRTLYQNKLKKDKIIVNIIKKLKKKHEKKNKKAKKNKPFDIDTEKIKEVMDSQLD